MTDLETTADEEQTSKTEMVEEKKDDLKSAKQFMFSLCEYITNQTSNGKTRLRILEWNVCWDWFTLSCVQYKNLVKDFVINEYKTDKKTSLNSSKNLQPFYDLLVNKVF